LNPNQSVSCNGFARVSRQGWPSPKPTALPGYATGPVNYHTSYITIILEHGL